MKLFKLFNFLPSFLLAFMLLLFTAAQLMGQPEKDCLKWEEGDPEPSPPLCETHGGLIPSIVLDGTSSPVVTSSFGSTACAGLVVEINGELIINSNFAFIDCTMKMGPGAKITVKANKTATFRDCEIFACDLMWQGIFLEGNSTGNFENNRIEDAQYAIYMQSASGLGLDNNVFNRNWMGVYVLSSVTISPFKNNYFTYWGGGLNAPYQGQSPVPEGDRSFVGMYIDGGAQQKLVQSSYEDINVFSQLNIGIVQNGYEITLFKTCRFEFSRREGVNGVLNGLETGAGILQLRGRILYTGFGLNSHTMFGNCFSGVNIEEGLLALRESHFSDNQRGIWVYASYFPRLEIVDNSFAMPNISQRGVLVEGPFDFRMNLKDCVFDQTAVSGNTGVETLGYLDEVIIANWLHIEHCTFNFSGGKKTGIRLWDTVGYGIENLEIDNNSFNYSNAAAVGISANNVWNCAIFENDFTSAFANEFANGTLFNDSGLSLAQQNFFQGGFANSMKFTGTCTGIPVNCNTFCGNQVSLEVAGLSVIDPQSHKGNVFGGGITEGKNFASQFLSMLFEVDLMTNPNFIPTTVSPSGWFDDVDDNGASLACAGFCLNANASAPPSIPVALTALDQSIADGSFAIAVQDDVLTWNASRSLYNKLQLYPSLIVPGSVFDSFYVQQGNGVLGDFEAVAEAIAGLLYVSTSDANLLDGYYAELDSLSGLFYYKDSLLHNGPNPNDSVLIAEIAALLVDIDNAHTNIDGLLQGIENDRQAGVAAVQVQNNALAATTVFQTNEKSVNQVLLDWVAAGYGPLTTQQLATLTGIASQCPELGGKAVYRAIAMLPFCDREQYLELTGCLAESASPPPVAKIAKQVEGFRVYPNPTDISLTVVLPDMDFHFGSVTLVDMMGRVVHTSPLEPTMQQLDIPVEGVNTGIYTCVVKMDGEVVGLELIQVLH